MNVLHGVSLDVHPGEIVVLVGPNGAGKSTLVRTISGLCKPTSGSVVFQGHSIAGADPENITRLGLAHCPEGRMVFQRLTVEENLLTGYLPGRASFAEIVEDSYSRFPILKEKRHQFAGRLSGGQQQMLAIARALAAQPKMLILDEPSLGLSPLMINAVLEAVVELSDQGMTILLIEQNVGYALEIGDHAYVIEHGQVRMEGDTTTLLNSKEIERVYLAAN